MTKTEIIKRLNEELESLQKTVVPLPSERFFQRPVLDKWSVAENVRHLVLAVRPLNLAFSLPVALLRLFGKPSHPSASYDDVVNRYQQKLREGAKASLPYQPAQRFSVAKEKIIEELISTYQRFAEKVNHMPEENLDRYFLPHPILGRITLREMLYFTVYHVGHHHKAIRERVNA